MKLVLALSIASSVVAMIVAAFLSLQYVRLQEETLSLKLKWSERVAAREKSPLPSRSVSPASAPMAAAPAEATLELADVMGKFQLHANKLFFAGSKHNWKLAAFYVEELEEAVADIQRRGNVMHGQVNVSGLMPALLMPEIENLERITSHGDAEEFLKSYTRLINACNTCHQSSQLPFIVISEPKTPALDNQRFEPLERAATAK